MSSSICISLVQMASLCGQLEANLQTHLRAIALSAQHQVVQTLSQAAIQHKLLVIAGCPLLAENGSAFIGALLCFPDGKVQTYRKQYLHPSEERYCLPGTTSCYFHFKGHNLALAICADFASPQHAQDARGAGTDIYLASALITAGGYQADSHTLADIARQGQCAVLLANYVGETGGWQSCGQSAIWGVDGELVLAADGEPGLLLCDIDNRQSQARQVPLQIEPPEMR